MSEQLERTALAEPDEPGHYLTARPQRLAILPSYWFWDREGAPFVRGPMAILAGVLVFTLSISGLPWHVTIVLASLLPVLSLGLFERYIRRRVMSRRLAVPELIEHDTTEHEIEPGPKIRNQHTHR